MPKQTIIPYNKFEQSCVDIYERPVAQINNYSQLTIGDLHSNAMLLMYFLVKHGIVSISKRKYTQLVNIYLKGISSEDSENEEVLSKKDIEQFNEIIDDLMINTENVSLIRLIGDEVCDRGQNDYFIFKIIDKLHQSDIKIEILLSNHGIEFLIPYRKNEPLKSKLLDVDDQANSLNNMRQLIEQGLLSKKVVGRLVENSYLPNLKLISYSLYQGNITLYSHAGIGLETIRALAIEFSVEYQDKTAWELARTIDAINVNFSNRVDARDQKMNITLGLAANPRNINVNQEPILFTIWNRSYTNLERPKVHNGYHIYYIHGHDSQDIENEYIVSLDNQLGKNIGLYEGEYIALESEGLSDLTANYSSSENPQQHHMMKQEHLTHNEQKRLALEQSRLKKCNQKFNDIIDVLKEKIRSFEEAPNFATSPKLKEAHAAANQLYNNLHKAGVDLYKQIPHEDDFKRFKLRCKLHLNEASKVLNQHRGWSKILLNIVAMIATLGVGYAIVAGIDIAVNNRFTLFSTDSSKKIYEIEKYIDNQLINKMI